MIPTTPTTSAAIPQYSSVHDVYGRRVSDSELTRWDDLCREFSERFHERPLYCARAPGRVNVLGEHIDYSLFPVLPAATQQDTVIALGPSRDAELTISNTDRRLDDISIRLEAGESGGWSAVTSNTSQWAAYARSAVQECLGRFFPRASEPGPGGMNWLVTGNLPQGAGLSSSAALVVSMVMAFLCGTGNLGRVNKGELVAIALAAEHRMGLKNGGLDHSASVMSHVECLTHLDFLPTLTATPVLLPPSLSLVISNSLTKHTLADPTTSGYNHRVAEVSLGALLLDNAWGVKSAPARLTLRDAVLRAGFACGNEEDDVRTALGKLDAILGPASKEWSEEDILERCAKVGVDCQDSLLPASRCAEQGRPRYSLRKRAQHTYDEVLRLAEFVQICRSLQESAGVERADAEDEHIRRLGRLMSATHDSLRDLYEATVPPVDELQRICLEHGSLGSRQMGGGWGGAIISLVKTSEAPAFISKLAASYAPYASLTQEALGDALFVTEPSNGASVYTVQ